MLRTTSAKQTREALCALRNAESIEAGFSRVNDSHLLSNLLGGFTMIKFYKNTGKGGNGEFVIQTDAKDIDEFESQFADAIARYAQENDDLEHAMMYLIPNGFKLAFKIAGYKNDFVHESRVLTVGHSSPSECDVVFSA